VVTPSGRLNPASFAGPPSPLKPGGPPPAIYCQRAISRIDLDDTIRVILRSQEIPFPIDRQASDFFQRAFGLERGDDSASKINTPDDIFVFGDVKRPGVVGGKRLRIAKLCLYSRPRVPLPMEYLAAANLDERRPRSQQHGNGVGQLHVPMLTRNINPGKPSRMQSFQKAKSPSDLIDASYTDFVQGARF
jgi:hypothetical protein